ncbi:XdhC family protein [Nocardia takedensis]|uniref:XdhC family protein n=1 Tax=Nocardia takedensis TaxID=259390 RepID=UPI003F76DA74
MRELLDQLIDLLGSGPVALARVVEATGAGPTPLGAAMIVTDDGDVLGSLSGGCVEAAVVESARQVIATGIASAERFGPQDDVFAVGLPCGGEVEIRVERVDATRLPLLRALRADVAANTPVALASVLDGDGAGALLHDGDQRPWRGVDRDARALLRAGRSGMVGSDDDRPDSTATCPAAARPRTFVQVFAAAPRMIVAGASDFVRALSETGRQLGYRVTVVDAREVFATPARFPAAHEVVVAWPHRYLEAELAAGRLDRRAVVCVLTHDPKFDVPTLAAALTADLAFVGALGSRRAHADRLGRLRAAGVADDALRRLHSPLGLDLNAHTPDETAISIAAQILAVRDGGSARPLADMDGPLHR